MERTCKCCKKPVEKCPTCGVNVVVENPGDFVEHVSKCVNNS